MKQWMQRRVAWIQNQFLSPPAVTRNAETAKSGPTVALKAASGKIYYTTDGSDPRLPGGNVSPKALPYSAPVVLKPGAKLMARAHQRNNWSPLTAASLGASERAQR